MPMDILYSKQPDAISPKPIAPSMSTPFRPLHLYTHPASMSTEPGLHTWGKKFEFLPTASSFEKREYFARIFKDPPNAAQLMTKIYTTDVESNNAPDDDRASSSSFRKLQFRSTGRNCENIFRAVMFLCNNLRKRARPWDTMFSFSLYRLGQGFKEMAVDLANAEPELRGVPSVSLHSLYERIILEKRNLDNFLSQSDDKEWTETQLSRMARELVSVDNDIKARDTRAAKGEFNRAEQEKKGSAPVRMLEETMVKVGPGLRSPNSEIAMATPPTMGMGHQLTGKNLAINTEQRIPSLPSGGVVLTSRLLNGSPLIAPARSEGAAITGTLPAGVGAMNRPLRRHAPIRQPLLLQRSQVTGVSLRGSSQASQFSNQGSQPSSHPRCEPTPVPSSATENNERKHISTPINLEAYIQYSQAYLQEELSRLEESRSRLEEGQRALRSAKALHEYQIAVICQDLAELSLDLRHRIQAVEARVGIKSHPVNR